MYPLILKSLYIDDPFNAIALTRVAMEIPIRQSIKMPGRFRIRQRDGHEISILLLFLAERSVPALLANLNPPFLQILLLASVQVNRRQAVINKARST